MDKILNVFIGRFQKFDYGPTKNTEKYGSIKPPEYNVSNISTKIHLIYGTNDNLVNPEVKKMNSIIFRISFLIY